MVANFLVEVTFRSWQDIHIITPIISDNYLFRGQENSNWGLLSKIDRNAKRISSINETRRFVRTFEDIYPKILTETKSEAFTEFILTRHGQGEYTSILDFSKSFAIALFFATMKDSNCDSAVFALNKQNLFLESLNQLHNEEDRSYHISELEQRNQEILYENYIKYEPLSNLLYLNPLKKNKRAKKQQTIHVINLNVQNTFGSNIDFNQKEIIDPIKFKNIRSAYSLVKFIIPEWMKNDIRAYLMSVNINDKTLFCD